jgi:hypothetical protein
MPRGPSGFVHHQKGVTCQRTIGIAFLHLPSLAYEANEAAADALNE